MPHRLTTLAFVICGVAAAGCRSLAPDVPNIGTHSAATAPGAIRTVRSADGVEIAFSVASQGETALVFIHGWSCDANYWREQLTAFPGAYTTLAVDLAGHGASGANRRDWTMKAYGEDVAAVIRSIPHRRVILIGHSMGGYVALEAARRFPDRVIGIIGVDTLQDLDGRRPDPEGAEVLLTGLRRQPRETTRAFVLETFFTEEADPDFSRGIAEDMASAPPSVAIPSMEALVRYDPEPAASALDIPLVAIVGDMMPVDEVAARLRFPRFRAVRIAGAGHFLHMEQAERFNTLLRIEIARLEAGAAGAAPTTRDVAPPRPRSGVE